MTEPERARIRVLKNKRKARKAYKRSIKIKYRQGMKYVRNKINSAVANCIALEYEYAPSSKDIFVMWLICKKLTARGFDCVFGRYNNTYIRWWR